MKPFWSSFTSILPHHSLRGHHEEPHHPQPPTDTQQQQQQPQEERGGQNLEALLDESTGGTNPTAPPLSNPLENTTLVPPSLVGNFTDDDSLQLDGPSTGSDDHMSVPALMLCTFLVVLLFWMTLPRNNEERTRVLQQRRRERRERREREQRMKDEQYREGLIPKCLHIQKVLKAEGDELTLGQPDSEDTSAATADNDNDQLETNGGGRGSDDFGDESSMCVICLEPFQVGDLLAWSKGIPQQLASASASTTAEANSTNEPHDEENPRTSSEEEQNVGPICNHVFHKECISSWLVNPKHDDCPACRSTIIKDLGATEDGGEMKRSDSEDSELDVEEEGGLGNMAFVVAHGLVSQVRRASYSLIGSGVGVISPGEEDEDEDEQFEDEHSSSGMEMVTPTSVLCPPANIPPPLAMRRVSSHEDRSSKPTLVRRRSSFTSTPSNDAPKETRRRSSFTSTPSNNTAKETAVRAPLFPPKPGAGRQSPFQLRRTLSAGTVSRATSEGSALLVKESAVKSKLPISSPFRRPSWTSDAEKALNQTLDDHRKSRASPGGARARSVVSLEMENPVSANSPSGEFRKVFRKGNNAVGLPPLPLTTKNASRQKSGYQLLDTTGVQHHSEED